MYKNIVLLLQYTGWWSLLFSSDIEFVFIFFPAGINASQYDGQFVDLFSLTMAQLKQVYIEFHQDLSRLADQAIGS